MITHPLLKGFCSIILCPLHVVSAHVESLTLICRVAISYRCRITMPICLHRAAARQVYLQTVRRYFALWSNEARRRRRRRSLLQRACRRRRSLLRFVVHEWLVAIRLRALIARAQLAAAGQATV